MRVKFFCDSGANIHSCRSSAWMDTEKDLGLGPGEWAALDEATKYKYAEDWALERIEIYFEEDAQ